MDNNQYPNQCRKEGFFYTVQDQDGTGETCVKAILVAPGQQASKNPLMEVQRTMTLKAKEKASSSVTIVRFFRISDPLSF